MTCNSVVISSGHGLYVRGASGILDEVNEARIVVEMIGDMLTWRGVNVKTFHDDESQSQNENLNRIVDYHNSQDRELDISVHFNAYVETASPMGVEVLYVSQYSLAAEMSEAIAEAGGFIDRGAKKRSDLFFLNSTDMPAILLEVCFVDSETDATQYEQYLTKICDAIAYVLSGIQGEGQPERPPRPERPPPEYILFHTVGACSHFGGPYDTGVSEDEGLAFIYEINEDNQQLFLPINTGTGLARQLNPFVNYVACRWDYDVTPKDMLAESGQRALVRALRTGRSALAFPADWGPHGSTDRVADLSPGLCEILGVETDDEVEVIYPWRGE